MILDWSDKAFPTYIPEIQLFWYGEVADWRHEQGALVVNLWQSAQRGGVSFTVTMETGSLVVELVVSEISVLVHGKCVGLLSRVVASIVGHYLYQVLTPYSLK